VPRVGEIGWGNCLVHGLRRWRAQGYRGALVITRSPNFGLRVHTSERIPAGLVSFVPLRPRTGWRAWFHKIWFKGQVVKRID
jgi:hypothetical protein